MDKIILEEPIGFQTKGAVVMIGRMNPATIGHYKVIDSMKAFIRKNKHLNLSPIPIVVIIDGDKTSSDKKKNPLSAEDRIKYMEASGNANGVRYLVASNAFAGFQAVRQAGFEPIVIAAGSDRAQKYLEMLDKYFTNNGEPVKHYAVPGLTRTDPDESNSEKNIDVSKVSGSMARAAVEAGYVDVFAKIVGLENKPKLAQTLFDKIKTAMQG